MGLYTEKCYSAKCCKCKKKYINDSNFSIFTDLDHLTGELIESDWQNENGELVCWTCTEELKDTSDSVQDLKVKPLEVEHKSEIVGFLKQVNWMCSSIKSPNKTQLEGMFNHSMRILELIK